MPAKVDFLKPVLDDPAFLPELTQRIPGITRAVLAEDYRKKPSIQVVTFAKRDINNAPLPKEVVFKGQLVPLIYATSG